MRNLLLRLCFDGKNYHGWQIQKNATSVQGVFQDSLRSVTGENCEIKACSRTDAGVHAREFCVNVFLNHRISCGGLKMALNRVLPRDIVVFDCAQVPFDFHARYSCVAKEYVYKILNTPVRSPFLEGYVLHYWCEMDLAAIQKSASFFVGTHDFSSFCTLDSRQKGDFRRTIKSFLVTRDEDIVTITVKADGFLYNMIRIMVGTLLKISQKRLKPSEISAILEAKNRALAGPTVRPCGLYLNRVFYE
ncbi:MAG: tRNA pseudouridine(38-40) synthase TruA [Oscillospiraceae bacterium]|jgi:tRNA pseudouridine38-40 synthase|nr:tRNA pseudouridine(38-40) synthase TruA [Oscillospiraceae bacterium]